MDDVQAALAKVEAEIEALGAKLEKIEADVEAARAQHDVVEVAVPRTKEEQLRKEKEQLRKEKEQLRTKEEQLRTKEDQLRTKEEQLQQTKKRMESIHMRDAPPVRLVFFAAMSAATASAFLSRLDRLCQRASAGSKSPQPSPKRRKSVQDTPMLSQ